MRRGRIYSRKDKGRDTLMERAVTYRREDCFIGRVAFIFKEIPAFDANEQVYRIELLQVLELKRLLVPYCR